MKVTEVIVSAGRTFSHPYEQYSNLKPHVTFKATLEPGDDPDAVTKALAAKAEGFIEDHKVMMLDQIRRLHRLSEQEQRMRSLERQISDAQQELVTLRSNKPLLEDKAATVELSDDNDQTDDDRLSERLRRY